MVGYIAGQEIKSWGLDGTSMFLFLRQLNSLPNDLLLCTKTRFFLPGLDTSSASRRTLYTCEILIVQKEVRLNQEPSLHLPCECQRAQTLGRSKEERAKKYG